MNKIINNNLRKNERIVWKRWTEENKLKLYLDIPNETFSECKLYIPYEYILLKHSATLIRGSEMHGCNNMQKHFF